MYLLVKLKILNGEYESYSYGVYVVPDGTDPAAFATEQARDFYDTDDNEDFDGFDDETEVEPQESFSFFAGAINVQVHSYRELTLEEYEVLNRFL